MTALVSRYLDKNGNRMLYAAALDGRKELYWFYPEHKQLGDRELEGAVSARGIEPGEAREGVTFVEVRRKDDKFLPNGGVLGFHLATIAQLYRDREAANWPVSPVHVWASHGEPGSYAMALNKDELSKSADWEYKGELDTLLDFAGFDRAVVAKGVADGQVFYPFGS